MKYHVEFELKDSDGKCTGYGHFEDGESKDAVEKRVIESLPKDVEVVSLKIVTVEEEKSQKEEPKEESKETLDEFKTV